MPQPLNLDQLTSGIPTGVSPAMGHMMAEAAAVLLERNGHHSGVKLEVVATRRHLLPLHWQAPHPDAKRSHLDLPEAAHYGAYGIAFLLALRFTNFTVIERSYKGTGFDYWLGTGAAHPFQRAARLEVSGIINDPQRLQGRIYAKIKQTQRSAGKLPAYVVVVEFGKPQAVWRKH